MGWLSSRPTDRPPREFRSVSRGDMNETDVAQVINYHSLTQARVYPWPCLLHMVEKDNGNWFAGRSTGRWH
jgi:ATP sulfurylase